MSENTENHSSTKKTTFLLSMRMKIIYLLLATIILSLGMLLWTVLPLIRSSLKNTHQNYMKLIGESYAQQLDYLLSNSETNSLSTEELGSILGNVKLDGVESSYAYLVDSDGIMLYHPTESKIGSPVENSVVKGIVASLAAGKVPEDDVLTYDFNGTEKYAGYAITQNNHWILVMTADVNEVLVDVKTMELKSIGAAVATIIIVTIFGIIAASLLIRPIQRLTQIINKMSTLDFTPSEDAAKLCAGRDETGEMCRATKVLHSRIEELIGNVKQVTDELDANSAQLNGNVSNLSDACRDNSATSQELAAGMEETAATTDTINENMHQVDEETDNVSSKAHAGTSMAEDIKKRANKLKLETQDASTKTKEIYGNVKIKTEEAMDKSRAVEKVSALSETINQIADQTSLLALNASIEAARAGDSGRGFAVVASEIGNLATQSATTSGEITAIVEEVHNAVIDMGKCMETMLEFMENTVLSNYENMIGVGDQYAADADEFRDSMEDIGESVTHLKAATDQIADSIEGISTTINEAAKAVTDIAEKTTDISGITVETSNLAEENIVRAEHLEEIISDFKF